MDISQLIEKRSRCTNIQKNFLVNAMMANRELATGVTPTPMGIRKQNKAWEALSIELNQLGPHKTAHQWKITWRDLRAKFKDRKNRRARQARNIAVVDFLTPQNDRISSIISKTTSEGIPGESESGISENEENESISHVKLQRQSSPFFPEGCVASLCDATITSPVDPLEVHHTPFSTHRPQSALSFEGIHQSTPPENLELLRDIAGSLQRTNFLLEEQNRISMERNDILRQLIGKVQEMRRLEKVEEGSQMVSRVNRFITKWCKQQQQPLSYFHAVLDPHSFSRSVENIYHVSFLVRDGLIAVNLDEEFGLPFITPVSGSQKERGDISDEKQFIVSIDMQRWQDLITAFDIQQPLMVLKR